MTDQQSSDWPFPIHWPSGAPLANLLEREIDGAPSHLGCLDSKHLFKLETDGPSVDDNAFRDTIEDWGILLFETYREDIWHQEQARLVGRGLGFYSLGLRSSPIVSITKRSDGDMQVATQNSHYRLLSGRDDFERATHWLNSTLHFGGPLVFRSL